ncbi:hypothetical protein ANO11243_051910 [Dothideomycetidae sp. 11243]|nr:hypothetical protein ANO11243_051910 [fungal sp. No.11243]
MQHRFAQMTVGLRRCLRTLKVDGCEIGADTAAPRRQQVVSHRTQFQQQDFTVGPDPHMTPTTISKPGSSQGVTTLPRTQLSTTRSRFVRSTHAERSALCSRQGRAAAGRECQTAPVKHTLVSGDKGTRRPAPTTPHKPKGPVVDDLDHYDVTPLSPNVETRRGSARHRTPIRMVR